MKFNPYEKRGAEKVLAMLKGEHNKFWGSFYAEALSFSYIEGGHEKYPFFKGGAQKVLACLEGVCVGGGGGCSNSFGPIFPFCSPPPSHN